MKTLGVYVQVPFCASKCSFCNFSSGVVPSSVFDGYTEAIEAEVSRLRKPSSELRPEVLQLPVDSLYFGGGTPSLLATGRLERVLRRLRESLQFHGTAEVTLETTPASADEAFLGKIIALGFNRLSIGAQSFDDKELKCVGRLHSAHDTVSQVERARRAGFGNISLDLLAGLPYQSLESWCKSLEETARLRPEHISVYLLEVDEKSRLGSEVLGHGKLYHAEAVPDEEFLADAYEVARGFLLREGYHQYEISNFARPGYESRHNQKYWQFEPYLGLGAGAHSFDGYSRWSNEAAPNAYEAKIKREEWPVTGFHSLTTTEQVEEFFFLGLRQRRGVNLAGARERWGGDFLSWWQAKITRLEQEGWMVEENGWVRLSERACLVSNEIFQEFLHVS
ncbi:MAG: radical SAM family heme chaperone HemW [Terriglobia bacterium]